MTEENKRAILVLAICVIGIWLLSLWMKPAQTSEPVESADDGFYAPYYWPNGINPSDGYMNGGPAFNSTVNVYAENPALGQLANQYIPIFGLVGMAGVPQ